MILVEGDKQILKHSEGIIEAWGYKDQIFLWGTDEMKTYKISSKK